MKQIKRIFTSGLLVLVPVVVTVWILDVLLGTVDSIFGPYLVAWGISSIYTRVSITVVFVFLLGLFSKVWPGNLVVKLINKLLTRVPIISKIYAFAKDTTDMVLEKQSFNTVVRLKFGSISVLGFLTNKGPNTVFVPTAPNVTSGIVVFTDDYEIIDMPVEAAMKQIISMGAISSKTYLGRDRNEN